ncbi:hypothetical protein KSU08_06935 [Fusobacterium nucleatum]|jgi:hypothetical protein
MDKLSKEDITPEELEKEIARSESMIKIANVIIKNGGRTCLYYQRKKKRELLEDLLR